MFRLVFARSALAETALRSMASLPAIAQIGKCRYMGHPSQGVADDGPFFECPGAVSFFRQVLSGHRRVINRDGDGSAGANRHKRRFTGWAEQSQKPDRLPLTMQRDDQRGMNATGRSCHAVCHANVLPRACHAEIEGIRRTRNDWDGSPTSPVLE